MFFLCHTQNQSIHSELTVAIRDRSVDGVIKIPIVANIPCSKIEFPSLLDFGTIVKHDIKTRHEKTFTIRNRGDIAGIFKFTIPAEYGNGNSQQSDSGGASDSSGGVSGGVSGASDSASSTAASPPPPPLNNLKNQMIAIIPASYHLQPQQSKKVTVTMLPSLLKKVKFGVFRCLCSCTVIEKADEAQENNNVNNNNETLTKTYPLEIIANISDQKLQLLIPRSKQRISQINFGNLYFTERRKFQALIVNNGPINAHFSLYFKPNPNPKNSYLYLLYLVIYIYTQHNHNPTHIIRKHEL